MKKFRFKKVINIIISPHHDDAILTFGGVILKALQKKEKVVIYVIYGLDTFLRDNFLDKLKKKEKKALNYIEEINNLANKVSISKYLSFLIKKAKSEEDWAQIGFLIRKLEDEALANVLGVKLINYDFPAGFPLRGYKNFNLTSIQNKNLLKKDFETQRFLLYGNINREAKSFIKFKQNFFNNSSFLSKKNVSLYEELEKLIRNNNIYYKFYFPSGIGGHPDHIILANFGYNFFLNNKENKNLSVYFGQDLPYAIVSEWFNYSPFKLYNLSKKLINIEKEINKKIFLLKNFYYSQFSYSEVLKIKKYHEMIAKTMDLFFLKRLGIKKRPKAIEVIYKLNLKFKK